jgi:hypothetical protein
MNRLIHIPEPSLLFGYDQEMEDPRDGLTLFGPLDEGKPYGIRAGIIGTKEGIRRFKEWLSRIQQPISNDPARIARPPFPGFEAVFKIPLDPQPLLELEIKEDDLQKALFLDDKYQRVFKTVELYSSKLVKSKAEEEAEIDLWFVVVPDDVYKYCRPESLVEKSLKVHIDAPMSVQGARELVKQKALFPGDEDAAQPYQYEVNFHNQLKARLLSDKIPTQVVRESTIAHREFLNQFSEPKRNLDALQSAIAWHISTAAFYKAGGRPWKLSSIRDGVCYIGLVFKQDERDKDPRSACCAAQMFLDSGDGVVFKGAVGPWHTPGRGDFHLSRAAAKQLVGIAVESYVSKKGEPPKELFIHGKVRFHQEEWEGFQEAVDSNTKLVGIRIHDERDLKLYRKADHPVLRGLAFVQNERTAYLWTKGFIPRLQTYPGREVPKPLLIDVCDGEARIETVLQDILALTKLNYNACLFSDGDPVTLKFADAIGEILTAGPLGDVPPLPFKYYI